MMEPVDRWTLRLVEKRHEYGSIFSFFFEPLSLLPFRAGQWLHLACEAQPSERGLVRHMSIASAPQDALLQFSMDLGSKTSYKMKMSALKVGDAVAAFKLRGDFTVEPEDNIPICFVAGGLGITPIRSILRDLAATRSTVYRQLIYVARDYHLFANELATLVMAKIETNHKGWPATLETLVKSVPPQSRFFVCGSQRFRTGILGDLQMAGIRENQIRTEDFR